MTGKVVTITSGKGGVGKTTATANISAALADREQKVVCIDADIGLRNLDVVLGLENRIVYDLVDVVEGRCRLRQAMIRDKRLKELYLIPSAQTRDKSAVSPSDMVRLCDELRPDYDWIITDLDYDQDETGRYHPGGGFEVLDALEGGRVEEIFQEAGAIVEKSSVKSAPIV